MSDEQKSSDRQSWEDQIAEILSGKGVASSGDEVASDLQAKLEDSGVFQPDAEGNLPYGSYESFQKVATASVAIQMYPLLRNLYTVLFASYAAAVDSGMEPERAKDEMAKTMQHVQTTIMNMFLHMLVEQFNKRRE